MRYYIKIYYPNTEDYYYSPFHFTHKAALDRQRQFCKGLETDLVEATGKLDGRYYEDYSNPDQISTETLRDYVFSLCRGRHPMGR